MRCSLQVFFVTIPLEKLLRLGKAQIYLAFRSTFRNFVRILSFSLYKGSLGDWGKTGLRIGNRTQFHILLWNAFNEHPTMTHQPYYGSSSGAKVIISFERTKSIHIFFIRACSTLLNWLWHLLWHQPGKCVLGYVLLLNRSAVSITISTICSFTSKLAHYANCL